MKHLALISLILLAMAREDSAQIVITPTTTLAAENVNNTSAPNAMPDFKNGNLAPGNISKVPLRSLLNPTFGGRLLAHYQPWWGSDRHVDIGMSEHDPKIVHRQVEDMISRGVDGIIVAEWNSTDWNLRTTQLVAAEVQQHAGFVFALMENKHALQDAHDPTGKLISDLAYAADHYFSMTNYWRVDGRPVVLFFDSEIPELDWKRAKSRAPGNPQFIFRNPSGFDKPAADGAFAWIGWADRDDPYGVKDEDKFYGTARRHSNAFALGPAWKGFDDSLASWGKGRMIPQRCGLTWLTSISRTNEWYDHGNQPQGIQIATWNDYEEGTELETGVNNCGTINAYISGAALILSPQFSSPDGSEKTVDHYTVFISKDGENLMPLADLKAGSRRFELGKLDLLPGMYYFFVKMIGRPMIRNQMSPKVVYEVGPKR
jgi:hypothetical protein